MWFNRIWGIGENGGVQTKWFAVWTVHCWPVEIGRRAGAICWCLPIEFGSTSFAFLLLPFWLLFRRQAVGDVSELSLTLRARLLDGMCEVLCGEHVLVRETVDDAASAEEFQPVRVCGDELVEEMRGCGFGELPGGYLFVEKMDVSCINVSWI